MIPESLFPGRGRNWMKDIECKACEGVYRARFKDLFLYEARDFRHDESCLLVLCPDCYTAHIVEESENGEFLTYGPKGYHLNWPLEDIPKISVIPFSDFKICGLFSQEIPSVNVSCSRRGGVLHTHSYMINHIFLAQNRLFFTNSKQGRMSSSGESYVKEGNYFVFCRECLKARKIDDISSLLSQFPNFEIPTISFSSKVPAKEI